MESTRDELAWQVAKLLEDHYQVSQLPLVDDVTTSGQRSASYSPRQARLPGMPEPPPDEWGSWDEYRDDNDPGFRVRDIRQNEVSTDEIVCLQDDELATARTAPEGSARTADTGEHFNGVDSPRFEQVKTASPSFGAKASELTIRYDAYGHGTTIDYPEESTVKRMKPNPADLGCMHIRVVFHKGKTGFEEHKELSAPPGTVLGGRYRVLSGLGAAAFSTTVRAVDTEKGDRHVCLKIIKHDKDFFDQSLDEIRTLTSLADAAEGAGSSLEEKRCLRLLDFFYYREHLILVTELLRDNLYDFQRFTKDHQPDTPYFTLGRLQGIARQLLIALEFIHGQGVVHCDLKPENIVFESYSACKVKVIDFGSACYETDRLGTYVQSRCYRAPEVVLGLPWDSRIDIWSLGCILCELWTGYAIFQNDGIQGMIARILGIIGNFPEWMMSQGKFVSKYFTADGLLFKANNEPQGFGIQQRTFTVIVPKKTSLHQRLRTSDANFLDFVTQCLQLDHRLRPSASELLAHHPWMTQTIYPDSISPT